MFTACAQEESPYLQDYSTTNTQIRAGFTPQKTNLVLGEPLQAIFTVKNIGPASFEFLFGCDYRATGRHDHFKITATNSVGAEVPDPITLGMIGGGIGTFENLKPGGRFTNVIDLTQFRAIDKPGVYTIDCSYGFGQFDDIHHEPTGLIVHSSFVFTILERTHDNVTRVINELLAKAQKANGRDLNETLNAIADFGKADAVPYLAWLTKAGSTEFRTGALSALSTVSMDASLDVVLSALEDNDPAIRTAAANALGAMQKPQGFEALLQRFPSEKSPVAESILRALGKSKSENAFPVITKSLDSGDLALQRAAIDALASYGGSNAVQVLREHINTDYLAVRYPIVTTLVEKLGQPMEVGWVLPVLMKREQDGEWHDCQRLLRLHGDTNAIPTLLSALDYDVPWSYRNWWILNEVQACSDAPHFQYDHDPNSDGTPEQWEQNRRTLAELKPLAGTIRPLAKPIATPQVKYLKTDPPINFAPAFRDMGREGVEIKSGFLTLSMGHGGAEMPYTVSAPYRSNYAVATRYLKLVNASAETHAKFKITPDQITQLANLSRQFAVKLCGSQVSEQSIGNFYNLLVNNSDYCPSDGRWWEYLRTYREAPPSLKEQTKTDLINSVVEFSQNYHEGTVEFAKAAGELFTPSQTEEILR